MKYLFSITILAACLFFFAQTNWFNSTFRTEQFYAPIFCEHFDFTQRGQKIRIPVHHTYNSEHSLAVLLHGKGVMKSLEHEKGKLAYRFISNGVILKEGKTLEPIRRNWVDKGETSLIRILYFDLPYPEAKELILELEVIEPMSFLTQYRDNTFCAIVPTYSPI